MQTPTLKPRIDPANRGVVIVGGGLSGLIAALQLARQGVAVTVFERKTYPFHRVCGEYISNETVPFLNRLGIYPHPWAPPVISHLQLTSVNGKAAIIPLDMGGFGISRYTYDRFLYEKAASEGVHFLLDREVTAVEFIGDGFEVTAGDNTYEAAVVMGAFGKRSRLDHTLHRKFITQRSPYVGVKYHIRTDHPASLIALHNFHNGYCGISNVEEGKSNLCYLTHRSNMKEHGNIQAMEEQVLFRNPFLRSIFRNSDFLLDNPEVINEISFESKGPVENNMLMIGDAAGMITPLCGNGMAMAIHASKLASDWTLKFLSEKITRGQMESGYASAWRQEFSRRLWTGRQVQRLFGGVATSNFAVGLAKYARPVAGFLVRQTHGGEF